MPIYDMICNSNECKFESPDEHYKSFEAFKKADKTCPECKDGTLERSAVQLFAAGRKASQTPMNASGTTVEDRFYLAPAMHPDECRNGPDCKDAGELGFYLVQQRITKKDPRMN